MLLSLSLALLFSFCALYLVLSAPYDHKTTTKMTLVHTNDIHAHLSPFNLMGNTCSERDLDTKRCFGGIARLKTVIDQVRETKPNVYLFDAGDQFQGTMFYAYYKGNKTAEYMNELKYDAMTIGNHEFDDGPEHAAKFFHKLQFPVVCSNIDPSGVPELDSIVSPYKVIRGNIGLVGVITNTTGKLSNAGKVTFSEPAQALQKAVDELHSKGINKIIAISHNGYHEDIDVASRTTGIHLIVGGHSHSLLTKDRSHPESQGYYPTAVTNLEGSTTYVVQAKAWGKYVGVLDIEYGPNGELLYLDGDVILVDTNIKEDPVWKQRVETWEEPFLEEARVVLGESQQQMDYKVCANKECALGNLITDSFVEFGPSGVEIHGAVMHSNGIRSSIDVGPVNVGQVSNMLPFDNFLVYAKYSGQQLRQAVETGLAGRNPKGEICISMLQLSSAFRLRYDATLPAHSRVTHFQVRDPESGRFVDVEDEKDYGIMLADFLVNGGDSLFEGPPKQMLGPMKRLNEVVEDYMKKHHSINPSIEGRIEKVSP